MCGVEGCSEEARVDCGSYELFKGTVAGEVKRGAKGCVREGFVRAGEREEREKEKLLVLRGGELREIGLCCVELVSRFKLRRELHW